jgi:hypothetical protein
MTKDVLTFLFWQLDSVFSFTSTFCFGKVPLQMTFITRFRRIHTQAGSANRWAVRALRGKQIATASLGRSGRMTITPAKGRPLSIGQACSIVSWLATQRYRSAPLSA